MVCRNLSAFADAPRAGSAEAKSFEAKDANECIAMHPVQAAPRQRLRIDDARFGVVMHPVQAAPRQRY